MLVSFWMIGHWQKTRNDPIEPKHYFCDIFHSMLWVWEYGGDYSIDRDSFLVRCQQCMTRIEVHELYQSVLFRCKNCGFSREVEKDFEDIVSEVIREIDRKLVTHEFILATKQMQPLFKRLNLQKREYLSK